MAKKKNRVLVIEILFTAALVAFIVFSFFTFVRDNNRRVVEQNNSLIESATEQTTARINDLISMSQRNVQMMAGLYSSTMSEPVITSDLLQDMISRSSFDYVEFISKDGIDLTADGRTADLSDREYFQSGMRGESGKCVIYHSRITDG